MLPQQTAKLVQIAEHLLHISLQPQCIRSLCRLQLGLPGQFHSIGHSLDGIDGHLAEHGEMAVGICSPVGSRAGFCAGLAFPGKLSLQRHMHAGTEGVAEQPFHPIQHTVLGAGIDGGHDIGSAGHRAGIGGIQSPRMMDTKSESMGYSENRQLNELFSIIDPLSASSSRDRG